MPIIISLVLVLVIIIALSKPTPLQHSNWNTLIDGLEQSSKEYYEFLQKAIIERKIDGVHFEAAILSEAGIFSSKREYLRITWKDFQYDVCAAPFGRGFFISWWLLINQSQAGQYIANIPFIGKWLSNKFFPVTYYKLDSASMFMAYIHQCVLEVTDEITKAKGIRSIPENNRNPRLEMSQLRQR